MSVYFVLAGEKGPVKIGCSQKPMSRVADLQTSSPLPLRLMRHEPGDHELEHEHHQTFAHLRLHGEWFEYSGELRALLDASDPVDGFDAYDWAPSARGAAPEGPWISVKDRLPETEDEVLVFVAGSSGFISIACVYEDNLWALDGVTHWMPLPAKPRPTHTPLQDEPEDEEMEEENQRRTTGVRDGLGIKKLEVRLGPEREAALDAFSDQRYVLTGKRSTRVALIREAVDLLLRQAEVKP